MFRKSEADRRHPVYRIDPVTGERVGIVAEGPARPKTRPPEAISKGRKAELEERIRLEQDREISLAQLKNIAPSDTAARLDRTERGRIVFQTADARSIYRGFREEDQTRRRYKQGIKAIREEERRKALANLESSHSRKG